MSWRADEPFNELPRLPPASQVLESTETLKACIGARASLAELKQAAELLPNQSLLINMQQWCWISASGTNRLRHQL